MKKNIFILGITIFLLHLSTLSIANTYYVANNGCDCNMGTNINEPWQTLDKVNNFEFLPGDSILFKRGDVWRGTLIPHSGDVTGYVYYGAYGTGDNPLFLGSVNLSNVSDWVDLGDNIWATQSISLSDTEQITNPSFDDNLNGWILYSQGTANVSGGRDTIDYASLPASYKVDCIYSGYYSSDIQLITGGSINIEEGETYCLSFKAKSSVAFRPLSILLIQSVSPYSNYATNQIIPPLIDTVWRSYTIYYTASTTASDAMIDFFLGNSLPDSSVFHIDDVSFKHVYFNSPIRLDVGNIIFNNEELFGVKKWSSADLYSQGDFYYDADSVRLMLYSVSNPAIFYGNIECALSKNIIDETNKSYVIYENLDLKYGAYHGIGGGNTNNIIIRSCNISYMGGGELYSWIFDNVRCGNGIEFWGNAQDNLVEQCEIWQIYDVAITAQNYEDSVCQSNIIFRNNLIHNCEWSFEFWNRSSSSLSQNIFFLNNTCLNAGSSWAHNQRPDKKGVHVMIFQHDAQTQNINIVNNIFYNASSAGLFVQRYTDIDSFYFNNNCWYQPNDYDTLFDLRDNMLPYVVYMKNQFSDYQNDFQQDTNSIILCPEFEDTIVNNYKLSSNSPCIDAGYIDTSYIPIGEHDFSGSARIVDGDGDNIPIVDIGCFEYENTTTVNQQYYNKTFIVYPNPAKDYLLVEILGHNGRYDIEIIDSKGNVVMKISSEDGTKKTISIKSLKKGIYFIKLKNDKKLLGIKKLIKT